MATAYGSSNGHDLHLNGNGYSASNEMLEYSTPDPVETECLEHYELNLGKYKGISPFSFARPHTQRRFLYHR
jgi:hypothetical protein